MGRESAPSTGVNKQGVEESRWGSWDRGYPTKGHRWVEEPIGKQPWVTISARPGTPRALPFDCGSCVTLPWKKALCGNISRAFSPQLTILFM